MKKTISRILFFISTLTLACACVGFQNNRLGTLAATLRFEAGLATSKSATQEGAHGKAIKPSESWAPSRFSISGTGPGGAEFSLDSTNPSVETKLVPGEWSIEVHGYSSDGKEVAAGTVQCLLQPGRTTIATITLYPLEGIGNLTLTVAKNLELPAGGRIKGSLTYKGLPGRPAPTAPTVIPIDVPAEQTIIPFEGIPAGHYTIALQLVASDGVVSGGCAETVVVMAGFDISGTCTIEMGMPESSFNTTLFPNSPLSPPLMSVSHVFSEEHSAIPLAIPSYKAGEGEEIERRWYLNGEEVGEAVKLTGNIGILPEGTLAFPQAPLPYMVSLLRADLVETSKTTFQTGSASVILDLGYGNDFGSVGWRAGYNYTSATSPSLYGTVSPYSDGTGNSYTAKAIAASPSGLVVISGMDEEYALHAFAAGYGADLDPLTAGGASVLSLDSSWLRLWRDKIKIGSSFKNADKLAVSDDGRFIAAASSSSNWLRLTQLGPNGRLIRSFSLTSVAGGSLENFQNLRAFCFSADSRKLYVAANTGGTIYAFDVGDSGIAISSVLPLWKSTETESLSLQDLKVTASGAIIVSANDASRIYVLSDSGGLAQETILQGSSSGTNPYKPSSLAVSVDGDGFYALCNEKDIVSFSRTDALSPYSEVSTFALPDEAEGTAYIVAGKPLAGTGEMIFAAGGNNVEFFDVGSDRAIIASRPLYSEAGNPSGIPTANGICFARGAFFLSGGTSGIVSVFGQE